MTSSSKQPRYDRKDSSEKMGFFMRDTDNTKYISPADIPPAKFWGTYSKVALLENFLNFERQEKYTNLPAARFDARQKAFTTADCFDKCMGDVETVGLNHNEKNCIVECYNKRMNAIDDINTLLVQQHSLE